MRGVTAHAGTRRSTQGLGVARVLVAANTKPQAGNLNALSSTFRDSPGTPENEPVGKFMF